MNKVILLFLVVMMALALWGRYRLGRAQGAFCSHCGKRTPCGCAKGRG